MNPRHNRARAAEAQPPGHMLAPAELRDKVRDKRHGRQVIAKRDHRGRGEDELMPARNEVELTELVITGPDGRPLSRPPNRLDGGPVQAWLAAVGIRLKWVRLIVATSQYGAADLLGVTQSTIAAYEAGGRLVPPEVAVRACVHWGLTTDYLYRGLMAGVRQDVALRLAAQHPELVEGPAAPSLPVERIRHTKALAR